MWTHALRWNQMNSFQKNANERPIYTSSMDPVTWVHESPNSPYGNLHFFDFKSLLQWFIVFLSNISMISISDLLNIDSDDD